VQALVSHILSSRGVVFYGRKDASGNIPREAVRSRDDTEARSGSVLSRSTAA